MLAARPTHRRGTTGSACCCPERSLRGVQARGSPRLAMGASLRCGNPRQSPRVSSRWPDKTHRWRGERAQSCPRNSSVVWGRHDWSLCGGPDRGGGFGTSNPTEGRGGAEYLESDNFAGSGMGVVLGFGGCLIFEIGDGVARGGERDRGNAATERRGYSTTGSTVRQAHRRPFDRAQGRRGVPNREGVAKRTQFCAGRRGKVWETKPITKPIIAYDNDSAFWGVARFGLA
jgi:hypothetical protein